MLLWCIALFVLGVFALMDAIFIRGEIYLIITSVLIIAISLWFFVTSKKSGNLKSIQSIEKQSIEPENQMTQTDESSAQKTKKPEKVHQ